VDLLSVFNGVTPHEDMRHLRGFNEMKIPRKSGRINVEAARRISIAKDISRNGRLDLLIRLAGNMKAVPTIREWNPGLTIKLPVPLARIEEIVLAVNPKRNDLVTVSHPRLGVMPGVRIVNDRHYFDPRLIAEHEVNRHQVLELAGDRDPFVPVEE
jgi:hypothetical protein